jgi:hypothetical protein
MPDNDLLARSLTTTIEMIQPKKGVYQVSPLLIGNDYVAIAPIEVKKDSSIIVPDEESTIGIIVGIGPLVPEGMRTAFTIGNTVRFNPKTPICLLDGLYPFYNKARIVLTRFHSILAAVSGEPVQVIGLDKAKE